jgi:hypothetical protein
MLFEPTLRNAVVSDAESLSALGIQVWLHTYATQGVRANIAKYVLAKEWKLNNLIIYKLKGTAL